MTLPYKKNFNIGRQSEQFLNEQLHQVFEALKAINYRKNENKGVEPDCIVDGGLWFDKIEESLKYWDLPTLTWKNVFSKKFQITDQILNITMPASPVLGQLWLYNGTLMYFDGSSWKPVKALIQDESQWSNAAFENFIIVTPLNPQNNFVVNDDGTLEIDSNLYTTELDDTHKNTNVIEPRNAKWGTDEWEKEDAVVPMASDRPVVPNDKLKSQYLIPNLRTDRIFLNELLDKSYEQISNVCIQYPANKVYDKTVSCVHLNPGKLTSITKRLIKVDKLNSTINIPAYNTEFYGFRSGEYRGHFLVQSSNQDSGDYIPSGDYILLNYEANQNYDYILAITYEFSSFRSSGSYDNYKNTDSKKSFFLANLKEPINVHANGLKLEEASYNIDYLNKTVTIKDDTDNVDIQMWSPYKKQFGYIRETDLEGNGIIHLANRVAIPLIFVGGILIHPLYGGLKFEENRRKIIIPNHSGINSMKNLPWCVVDLSSGSDLMYSEKGTVEKGKDSFLLSLEDYLDGNGNFIIHGTLQNDIDSEGFRDYILASGKFSGINNNSNVIHYNNKKINKDDSIILFINGFMINEEDIVRNHAEGIITVKPELVVGQEYVLLRDDDKRLYSMSSLQAAFATGYFDDSLVYLNGELLANTNAVLTTNNETKEALTSTNNEIKCFIASDGSDEIKWKLYDTYNYEWRELNEEEIAAVSLITSSYTNLLTSVKINLDTTPEDIIDIYSFKFANSVSGVYKINSAYFVKYDEEDNKQIWAIGSDLYSYKQNDLNLYCNGIKMIPNVDYKEMPQDNFVKIFMPVDIDNDKITYFIEPIEDGETFGKELVLLDNKNTNQPNIYELDNNDSTPDLYPGRLTVYINGIRLPKDHWILLNNKRIMLKYTDFIAVGNSNNYPIESIQKANGQIFEVKHNYPAQILIEIRKDYDRLEATVELKSDETNDIYLKNHPEINQSILDTKDEVLFFLNGQYLGLSRSNSLDYRLDTTKECVSILSPEIVEMLTIDPLKSILDKNSLAYASYKIRNGGNYEPTKKNMLTLVWR